MHTAKMMCQWIDSTSVCSIRNRRRKQPFKYSLARCIVVHALVHGIRWLLIWLWMMLVVVLVLMVRHMIVTICMVHHLSWLIVAMTSSCSCAQQRKAREKKKKTNKQHKHIEAVWLGLLRKWEEMWQSLISPWCIGCCCITGWCNIWTPTFPLSGPWVDFFWNDGTNSGASADSRESI